MNPLIIKLNKLFKKYHRPILIFSSIIVVAAYITHYLKGFSYLSIVLYLILTLLCGTPILLRAYSSLILKVIGIELLVSIAVMGALWIGEYSEAGMVTYLFQLGNFLELITLEKTRQSIQTLTQMAPSTASKLVHDEVIEVSIDEVEIDDILLVKAGEKVPVDGVICYGDGFFDESSITGESKLAHKYKEETLFAGTLLDSGTIEMKASRVGDDTTFAKIIQLVEEAQDAASPVEKFIDHFSKWYTPFVIVIALIVWALFKDLSLAITVLVLACPGALVIGAPVANVAGIGSGARQGILLKGGDSIHTFAHTDVMIFDKTGTLTKGKPGVSHCNYYSNNELNHLRLTALAQTTSTHPIAFAIKEYALSKKIEGIHQSLKSSDIKGMGIRVNVEHHDILIGNKKLMQTYNIAMSSKQLEDINDLQSLGYTIALVAIDQELVYLFGISDTIKEEARDTLCQLKKLGIKKSIMLSGDHQQSAHLVGVEIGIDEIHGELLPQDKLNYVKHIQTLGHNVAFVGDGINDSPAIVCANTGIAMGSGTDVAIETSDVVLVKSDLKSLVQALSLSKKTLKITHQNLIIAIGTVILLLIGLFAGYIHMASGMFIHELSILLVIINAMRLLKKRKEED